LLRVSDFDSQGLWSDQPVHTSPEGSQGLRETLHVNLPGSD
jgi:hypothetical protein